MIKFAHKNHKPYEKRYWYPLGKVSRPITEKSWGNYDFKINGKVFTKPNTEFNTYFNKILAWDILNK